nr:MAG TPA: hypothetical protein [Caudoviricetes sp.]
MFRVWSLSLVIVKCWPIYPSFSTLTPFLIFMIFMKALHLITHKLVIVILFQYFCIL